MYNSGRRGKRANDGYGILSQADRFNQTEYPIPIVTSFAVTNGSYVPLDDTAASTAGGQTIVVYGSGFAPGATIMVGGSTIGSVTYLDQGRLTFTSPANVSGSYTIIVMNANGGTGILVPGLVYSGVPTWSTSAGSVGSQYERTNVSSTFVATGDAPVTYSVLSGSLPPGTSLSATGVLSGSAPAESGSTTYSFTIRATDGQLQDSDRSFSLTINTDVVTWSTPTNNQVISGFEYAPISNVTASASSAAGYSVVYSANTVPTGITVNATTGVISGTVNTVGNTFTRLTATANTTTRTAIRDVVFNINPDVVTWNSPADQTSYSLIGGTPIANVTLSASSAAGRTITYTANALPSGLSISGSVITGTPNAAQTVTTLLTATADTTNRSATRTISWSINLGDLNWNNTVLLLSANTPTPTFVTDTSLNNYQLAITGDARASNFDPYMGGYYSNYFDGTGDYLTIPDNTTLQMGSGNFTIEFWIYYISITGYQTPFTKGYTSAGDILFQTGNGNGALIVYLNGSAAITESTGAVVGQWYHYALVRSDTTVTLYRNGISVGTATSSVNFNSTQQLGIGASGTAPGGNSVGAFPINGYMSNVRVVKGTALYTVNFTPPTSPLTAVANTSLLTCQSNRLIDTSVNNFTVTKNGDTTVSSAHPFVTSTTAAYNTGYSTTFDGSGDYLTIPASASMALGSGDFTIEAWIYTPSTVAQFGAIVCNATNPDGFYLSFSTSNFITFSNYSTVAITSSSAVPLNTWTHVAVTRSGTSVRMFFNGVSVGSATNSTVYGVSGATNYIGFNGGAAVYTGLISNLRVIKGTALYTTTFTPPTSSLTAVANTSLLTCQNATLIDNSTNNLTITNAGQAQPIAVSPFTMTTANTTITNLGSAYFDGTSDVVTLPAGQFPNLGTSNFTMEAWVYATTSVGTGGIFDMWNGGTTAFLLRRSGTTWQFYVQGGSSIGVATLVPNTWYHVAAVRNGTTISLYINGISVGVPITAYSTSITSGGVALGIGGTATSGNESWTGYITDARIVVGTALYTGTFLPPQAPLTPIANTVLLTCQTNGGANNSAFMDQSSFNNIITRTGVVTQGTFSPYSQNGWSNFFDGTGDYLTTSTNAAFTYGTSDFTIEMWVYITANPADYAYIYSQGPNSTASVCVYISGGKFNVWNGSNIITGSTSYLLNTWYHVALTRSGTSLRLFVNGVQDGSVTNSSNITTGTTYGGTIGRWIEISDTRHFTGYVSNLRVVKGQALYTSAFTPSTSPLTTSANTSLLTCQDNRFIDESPNSFNITRNGDVSVQAFSPFGGVTSVPTSYSVYFDGSGDQLTTSSISFTGNYTVELWFYATTQIQNFPSLFAAGTNLYLQYAHNDNPGQRVRVIAGTTISPTTTVTNNAWHHFAVVRSGSTVTVYVDGTNIATATDSSTIGGTVTIGGQSATAGTLAFAGYISNVRVVNGTAVYTSNFTPSTTPLTVVANTSLLTCQSVTMVDNSTNYFTLTASGDTKPLTFNPFGQTNTPRVSYSPSVNSGSIYFNGGGNYYLNVLDNPSIELGSSDFTLEGWFYWTGTLTGWTLFQKTSSYELKSDASRWVWQVNGASNVFITSFTPIANQWYHIALVRTTTTTKLYVNGVLYTSGTSVDAVDNGNPLLIGFGSAAFVGYASDIRITRTALYTANFFPGPAPATPTTTIGANRYSSSLLINGTTGGTIDYHSTNVLDTFGNTLLAPQDPYAGNYYSAYFDGTGDNITVPNSTNFAFGTGDFTIEFWIKTGDINGGIISQTSGGWSIVFANGVFYWQSVYNATNLWTFNVLPVIDGKWHHVAFVRSSGTTKLYYDGTQVASNADSTNYTVTGGVVNMGYHVSPAEFQGNLSNLRVVKGTALYTSAFTPSTTPLTTTSQGATASQVALLTFQSNKFIDSSPNNLAFTLSGTPGVSLSNPFQYNTGKSIYFDGTGDYLSVPVSPNMTFGSSDFTFETWVYPVSVTSQQSILYLNANTSGYCAFGLQIQSGALNLWMSSTGAAWSLQQSSIGTIVPGVWTHIAVTKSGTTMKVYINGTQAGTNYTVAQSLMTTYTLNQIGVYNTSSYLLTGYLKDLRITKAVRYTTTFTPPTTPLDIK